jgi:hypothetical protein
MGPIYRRKNYVHLPNALVQLRAIDNRRRIIDLFLNFEERSSLFISTRARLLQRSLGGAEAPLKMDALVTLGPPNRSHASERRHRLSNPRLAHRARFAERV